MTYLCRILQFYGQHLRHPGHWRFLEKLLVLIRPVLPETALVRAQGLLWNLHPRDRVQADLFWYGEKDRWDMLHLKKLLSSKSPVPVILDVGANFGFYSLVLAQHLDRSAQVHAFEPGKITADWLESNVKLNHLEKVITIHRLALGAEAGLATLGQRGGDSGQAHLMSKATDGESVVVETMDNWVRSQANLRRVDFIKMDVEGYEPEVLLGGTETLKQHRPLLLIELNPNALARNGHTAAELVGAVEALNYKLMVTRRKKLVPLTSLPASGEFVNVIGVPL